MKKAKKPRFLLNKFPAGKFELIGEIWEGKIWPGSREVSGGNSRPLSPSEYVLQTWRKSLSCLFATLFCAESARVVVASFFLALCHAVGTSSSPSVPYPLLLLLLLQSALPAKCLLSIFIWRHQHLLLSCTCFTLPSPPSLHSLMKIELREIGTNQIGCPRRPRHSFFSFPACSDNNYAAAHLTQLEAAEFVKPQKVMYVFALLCFNVS